MTFKNGNKAAYKGHTGILNIRIPLELKAAVKAKIELSEDSRTMTDIVIEGLRAYLRAPEKTSENEGNWMDDLDKILKIR